MLSAQSLYHTLATENYTIIPVRVADIVTKTRTHSKTETVYNFIIKTKEATLMLDAGIDESWNQRTGFRKWFFRQYSISNRQDMDSVLRRNALTRDSLDYLVLTHLHFDHIMRLASYQHVTKLVSRKEHRNYKIGLLKGYYKIDPEFLLNTRVMDMSKGDSIAGFRQAIRLADQLYIAATPGHTAGHISLFILDGQKSVLFTGDTEQKHGAFINEDIRRFIERYDPRVFRNHTLLKEE